MDQRKSSSYKIADVLINIGRKECLEKAELLLNSEQNSKILNLRSLDLETSEAEPLALVLYENQNTDVESISFSYNSSLKDEGAVALIKSSPHSIRELGFVNCGMGDIGGQALLNWMRDAPHLKMMCAELNHFSDKLKSEFKRFSMENRQILVVV